MFETLLGKAVSVVGAFVFFFTGVFAPTPLAPAENLSAQLPSGTAVFETSLATAITANATTMTLTSNSVRGGGSLSGYQCFTVDEGSAQAEYICGTVATTTVTSLERGLSPADGVTEDTDLQFSHRRGASVKITDFPLIQRIQAQNSGEGTFDAPITYAASVSTTTLATDGQNLASVAYANALSFGAVAASSETTAGFVQLATSTQIASSTSLGSTGARLVIPASLATSSATGTMGNRVVVTRSDGTINPTFFPDTVSSSSIKVYTATSTWTKPANLKHIVVEIVGAGGGGGGAQNSVGAGSGGGGGGGYCLEAFSAAELSGTSTVFIRIGGGGTAGSGANSGSAGGFSSFSSFASSTGGSGGLYDNGGGSGGLGQNCDVNGGGSGGGTGSIVGTDDGIGGAGGSSYFGGGGTGVKNNGGNSANSYGGGGAGAADTANAAKAGGTGADGVVVITEYF